jgi:hypothetical protein
MASRNDIGVISRLPDSMARRSSLSTAGAVGSERTSIPDATGKPESLTSVSVAASRASNTLAPNA